MYKFKVKSNFHERTLCCLGELPKAVWEDFDYITNEEEWYSPRFFQYRGEWYDTGDCEVSTIPGWTGMFGESHFSAVVFTYGEDWDSVVVGYATC